MKINDFLIKECMIMDLEATDKLSAINEMIQKLYENDRISDISTYREGILKREEQSSTGLGDGIAMPHAKNTSVKHPTVLFAKSKNGLDYQALDGSPVFLFFMIAAPEGANDVHLSALSSLARLMINSEFVEKLKKATSTDEIQNLFRDAEQEIDTQQNISSNLETSSLENNKKFVVAVTACPTGIAHTYMAEDALKKKAAEMGIGIKVETNGSDGVKNRLTFDDIQNAEGVIIAADKNVEMDRFDGKHTLIRPVSDGIRKTEELINLAFNKKCPIHQKSFNSSNSQETSSSGSIGSQIYKHLMSGVSNMLPFVIGGGIAIAIAFLIDQFIGVPQDSLGQLGSYNQAAKYFMSIGGSAFDFMLPILAGFIAYSIADRPGLIVGFVAGAMASSGVSFSSGDAVSAGFLGALAGGFLGGYVIIFLKSVLINLPKSLDGIKTILFYPVFGVLITGFLMLVVNIPMSAINIGLNDFLNSLSGINAAILCALVAGMMTIDLGGPVNKTAYVFGTGTLAATVSSGGSTVMAAVMAGGMVPPLAIFVSTLLFKNKYSKSEQETGLTNVVMGASFITEGAIPFAASDPIRVIPGFIVGSALSGSLVGAFGIKLIAPHGGIFVIFLISKPILYLIFVIIGALLSGFILGFMKKKTI